MAVAAAGGDERAVEAVAPGAVFIHVPQTVLIAVDRRREGRDGEQHQSRRNEGHFARRKDNFHGEIVRSWKSFIQQQSSSEEPPNKANGGSQTLCRLVGWLENAACETGRS